MPNLFEHPKAHSKLSNSDHTKYPFNLTPSSIAIQLECLNADIYLLDIL